MSSVRYTDRHKGRGQDYHETFSPDINPHRALVWRLEREALDQALSRHPLPRPVTHLDFACGTGRLLEHFASRVSAATGVDVSGSMLAVARAVAPQAELIEADLTQADVLGERRFGLVTAFRFFPNAEPELRRAVLAVLRRHLAPGGLLIFNNHKNRDSLRRRVARRFGRRVEQGTMSLGEAEALVQGAGLRVLERIPIAILPVSQRRLLMPIRLVEAVERWIGPRRALTAIAQDIIYVCGPAEVRPS